MASSYLTLDEFKQRTMLPESYVDAVELEAPGFTLAQVASVSSLDIDGRLRKRYACPFQAPVPEAVKTWATRMVSFRVLTRRGWDPQDPSAAIIEKDLEDTLEQIKEAADAEKGLFDLPLLDSGSATGISSPATRAYSEQSPYVGFDRQACIGRDEDRSGGGTFT